MDNFKKGMKVKANVDIINDALKIDVAKGQEFTFVKEHFRNGEHWMTLLKSDGTKIMHPSVFFYDTLEAS